MSRGGRKAEAEGVSASASAYQTLGSAMSLLILRFNMFVNLLEVDFKTFDGRAVVSDTPSDCSCAWPRLPLQFVRDPSGSINVIVIRVV